MPLMTRGIVLCVTILPLTVVDSLLHSVWALLCQDRKISRIIELGREKIINAVFSMSTLAYRSHLRVAFTPDAPCFGTIGSVKA